MLLHSLLQKVNSEGRIIHVKGNVAWPRAWKLKLNLIMAMSSLESHQVPRSHTYLNDDTLGFEYKIGSLPHGIELKNRRAEVDYYPDS
jgi:hypothetical protein